MNFRITLTRTVIQNAEVLIRAATADDAERRADDLARNAEAGMLTAQWSDGEIEGEIDTDIEPINDDRAARAIVEVLDRRQWSPDTLERIAEILRAAGYEIREPEPEDD